MVQKNPLRSALTIEAVDLSEETALRKLRGAVTRKGMGEIAKRIARIRREQGVTQEEMARQLGVSQPVYSAYERGELRLHGELLKRIAELLGASVDEFVGLKAVKGNGGPKDRRFVRRLQKVDTLSKRDKEALLRTIDAFLGKTGS